MTDIIWHCPDCGRDRSLEQLHRAPGWCPDFADACCHEWYCRLCGAALLIGDVPATAGPARPVAVRDRVA